MTDDHKGCFSPYLTFTSDPYGARHGPPQSSPPRISKPARCRLGQRGRGVNPGRRNGHQCRPFSGIRRDHRIAINHSDRVVFRPTGQEHFAVDHHTQSGDSFNHSPEKVRADASSPIQGELVMGSVWWYVARSSGLVAWGLASLAVLWGLFLSTKVMGKKARPNWLLDLHRFLGGLTVVFIAIHLGGLFLDPYIDFGAAQLLIPFASTWKPLAVAWGVVAFYVLLAVEITSLLRKHIPKKWWKAVHMSSYAVFVLGTVHLLTAGTDRHSPILLWTVAGFTAAVAAMTLYRIITPRETRTIDSDTIRAAQPIG